MPTFLYRGYNTQGQKVGGSLRMETRARMEETVKQLGVTDFTVFESKTRHNLRPYALVGPDELALFCRETAVMLAVGIPVSEGVPLLAGQSKSEQFELALTEIGEHLSRGMTLVSAMRMYNHIFGAFLLHLVSSVDAPGDLMRVFNDMAVFFDREASLRTKLRSALLYPVARMLLLWCAVFLLISHCLPVFDVLLAEVGIKQGIEGIFSGFALLLYTHGWIVVSLIVGTVLLLILAINLPKTRRWIDKWLATLALFRVVAMPIYTVRLARGLSLSLKYSALPANTEPFLHAMIDNRCLEEKIQNALRRLQTGQELPAVLETVKHYPPFFSPAFQKMLLLGHQYGKMTEMMARAAEWFEAEMNRNIERTSAILEPALLILLVLLAGLPLLSILLSLTNAMH